MANQGDSAEVHWVPLESNPDVLTAFARTLGISNDWRIGDVWSPEPDLLALVPSPCLAVMFLYPLTAPILAAENARASSLASLSDQTVDRNTHGVFFVKQTIRNACGTIALMHAVLNNRVAVPLRPASFFETFLQKTESMSPEERAAVLQTEPKLNDAHREFAAMGQTEAPNPTDDVDLHFVAFIQHGGVLYELDGRKNAPVAHGPSSADTFLLDACQVIKSFMVLDPSELRYTILALTPDPKI